MKSNNAFLTLLKSRLVLGFGLILAGGCANQDNPAAPPLNPDDAGPTSNYFPADSGVGKVMPFATAQIVNGAREDANVVAADFTGTKLNSLGTEKLTRMVPDDGNDVTVYLNIPADEMLSARRDAVAAYMATCGVETTHLKIENGANPHVTSDSAAAIAAYPKTENTDDATTSSTGGGAAPSSGSSSGSH